MALERSVVERLRWGCRRGMLELDLLLTAYLERTANRMSSYDALTLQTLLDQPDPILYDWLMGYRIPDDRALRDLVGHIRDPSTGSGRD